MSTNICVLPQDFDWGYADGRINYAKKSFTILRTGAIIIKHFLL
jgi:hypothetical protein